MNSSAILIYILKSIFISGVFTAYYWIALRNKNFNYYNRFYLLLSISCSLIIPLFNFTWFTFEKEVLVSPEKFSYLPIKIAEHNATPFPWVSIATCVVIGISLALIAMFARNILKVYKLKRNSAVLKMDDIDFIYTDLEHAPFSFLNNLFWKESISMDSTYGKKIFKHELAHIHQKHTLDILFCQIVNAILWMNPFNWLIQKELKAIHEFIADKEAIGNNDVEDFARLLLQAHFGNHFLNPTHSFYYSSIKRRLLMLSTTHRTKFSYLRRVLVLPISIMAIAALSISTTESKATPVETPAATVDAPAIIPQQRNESPAIQPVVKTDTLPTPVTIKLPPAKKPTNPVPPKKDSTDKTLANVETVIIRDVLRSDAITPDISARASGVKFEKSPKEPITKLDSSIKRIPGFPSNAIFFYDGKRITIEEVYELDPNQIKIVNVWKGENAVKKFGEAGANGVIELFSKNEPI